MSIERLREISEKTLQLALKDADEAQATVFLRSLELTRYANSQIHQNIATKTGGVVIKVVVGKRIGLLRADVLEMKKIEEAVKKAINIAKVSPINKDFKSLPKPEKWTPLKDAFDQATANCDPEYRVERVKEAINVAHSKSPNVKAVAGSISSGSYAVAISNSLGVSAHTRLSLASMNVTVISETDGSESFGYAEQRSRHVAHIDPIKMADKATEKSINGADSLKIQPGEYEVVLSPLAVNVLLFYLAFIGFSAAPYQRGESFVKYHLGEQIFDRKFSVIDDAHDHRTFFASPIDGEGVPKRLAQLVDRGTVSEHTVCHNSLTAGRENRKSTGHQLLPGIVRYIQSIPFPINMLMKPGDATLDEMIEETRNGIFITRFHYTNPVDPTKAVLTGLTRDGTFLIQDGSLARPIRNMRFTDSMLSALRRIHMIGKELHTAQTATVPAMKLEKLRFTGVTTY